MKIITLSKEEFDSFSNKHKYNTYYQSSDYAQFSNLYEQYNIHYLGFVEENSDKLIGAALMLYKTLFWGYKYAYSPRGMLIDYDNPDIINEVTYELKKLLKKQKFIFVTIDPVIVASERDKNGKIIQFNNMVNRILSEFKNNNYEHLGFNLYNESILPRWNVIARLNSDGRVLYNNFSTAIKEKISYANNMALSVSIDETLNIDEFFEFVKKDFSKKGKKYFQVLANCFKDKQKMKIFYVKIDTKQYTENANKLYNKEEENNIELANIIQSGDTIKYNMPEIINAKVKSDKLLHTYKKDIVASTKLLKAHPEGIKCGAALTIEDAHGVNVIINYAVNEYKQYFPDILMTYELMKYFGKMDYKYINIGAITGNFDPNSKYYPMLENKVGFNSSILEYVGQFDIILNPTMYKIYKRKYKK